MFINGFIEFATALLTDNSNIITGDFNLHISEDDNTDTAIFTDTFEAVGPYQFITFSTHKSGNTLDLLLTEVASDTMVLRTHRGPFISDHAAVIAQLNTSEL